MIKTFTRELVAMLGIVGLATMAMAILQPILPLYLDSIGVAPAVLGLMFSTGMAGMVIGESTGGWLADRIGFKIPMIVGTLVCAPLVLSFSFTRSPALIFIIFFFWGIVRAVIFGPSRGYIGTRIPLAYKATFMAIYATAMAVSRSLGSFTGGLIADVLNYHWVFYTAAAIGITGGIVALLCLKNRTPKASPMSTATAPGKSVPDIPLYRHKQFIFQSAVAAMQFAAIGISPFLSLLAAEVAGLDATRIGLLFTIGAVVNALMLVPMGRLADRHSKRKMMVIGLSVVAASQAVIGFAGGFSQLAAGVIIQSTGSAIFGPAAVTLLSEVVPQHRQNTAMGIYGGFEDIGVIIGSAIGGVVWSTLGPTPTFLIVGSGSALLGAVISLVFLKKQ